MEKLLKRSAIFKDRLDDIKTLFINDQISNEEFDDMKRTAAYNYSREPKSLGSGMYVYMRFRTHELVTGDTFFDSDYGMVTWNGITWVNSNNVELDHVKI